MENDILVNHFLKLFPEFHDCYIEHLDFNQEFLAHVFFGDEVSKHVEDLLRENSDIKQIEKFFIFFEWMATQTEIYIVQVLSTTILYNIGGDIHVLEQAKRYMKPYTKKLSQEIEDLHSGKYFS
ncbi:hypothetical protein SAMN05720606_112191 [Paenibacillus polysaccharolyticus]|uniref:DUF7674 domain-containing protein n=1 Tax=Paenibacillus polysaccharolyticus TaxID=582692 RepID=A0A1G5JZ12_9BACL|nr:MULTISPECIES: hypothetical protein [Paenibacillus]SCY93672.1 hypothetical protein SAMN05720606_112191 [Paenibacillus polysaccharolyticus]